MATATKTAKLKSKKAPEPVEEHAEHDHDVEAPISKGKKPIEIDEPEPVVGIDEKIEEDPLLGAVEEDDSAEEISLDGEELNPFGDRWEE
jgi:hypothetical protein